VIYKRATTALILTAAVLILAGGYVHLHEWFQTYRAIPAAVPGAAVVRVGFPLNAATSLAVAGALVATVLHFVRYTVVVIVAAIVFQAASLAALVLSRTGSVFGWTEPVWTPAANQTRVVEVGALIAMAVAIAIIEVQDRAERRQSIALSLGNG
jgi:hypothetical protein